MCVNVNPCEIPIKSHHPSAEKKKLNKTTFHGCPSVLNTQLAKTTFMSPFKCVFTLDLSIVSALGHRLSLFSFLSAIHSDAMSFVKHNNVLAKHNGKSVVLIMRIKHREQSCLCLCSLFEGGRNGNVRLSLRIMEALWASVKGRRRGVKE